MLGGPSVITILTTYHFMYVYIYAYICALYPKNAGVRIALIASSGIAVCWNHTSRIASKSSMLFLTCRRFRESGKRKSFTNTIGHFHKYGPQDKPA